METWLIAVIIAAAVIVLVIFLSFVPVRFVDRDKGSRSQTPHHIAYRYAP